MPDNVLYPLQHVADSLGEGLNVHIAIASIPNRYEGDITQYLFIVPNIFWGKFIDLEFWDIHFFIEGEGELYFYEITADLFTALLEEDRAIILAHWHDFLFAKQQFII
jgi:hypothetical protein